MSAQEPVAQGSPEGWDDHICWFCKKRPAHEHAKHWVELYRVLERKQTYVVVGIEYKQKYTTSKTWVPRCSRCKAIHDWVGIFFGVVWLIVGIGASTWYLTDPSKRSASTVVNVFGGAIGVVMVFSMCGLALGAVYWFTSLFWKSEDTAADHPRVRALTAGGWGVGDKPPYKW